MAQNYDIQMTKFNGTDYDNLYPKTRVSGTSGNLVSLNSSGELQDSGIGILRANLTLYVNASSGNDSNDGLSSSKAKKTIQAAVDAIPKNLGVSSAFINVAAGTYNESVIISGFYGGMNSDQDGIRLLGAREDTTIINGGLAVKSCATSVYVTKFTVKGETFKNTIISGRDSLYIFFSDITVDASSAINVAASLFAGTTVSMQYFTTNNAAGISAIGISEGTLYANTLLGSNNHVGVLCGSDSSGVPGLAIIGTNLMQATIKYKRIRGGVIIENSFPYTYGTTDLTAGVSPLDTGMVHFVYE